MKKCEVKQINKNPKYRIIKYNNEYFMVDLVSNWISYIFPMINWFIPKKCIQISKEEAAKLSVIEPIKNNNIGFICGSGVLLSVVLRKYINILDFQAEKLLVLICCCLALICIITFFIYLNKKLVLNLYVSKAEYSKMILIPTLKNIGIILLSFCVFGFIFIGSFWMLVIEDIQNIFLFISMAAMFSIFMCLNIASICDTTVRVKLITKGLKK